ncbi:hypothetical protein Tco_0324499 [Tanacetum coccineum]
MANKVLTYSPFVQLHAHQERQVDEQLYFLLHLFPTSLDCFLAGIILQSFMISILDSGLLELFVENVADWNIVWVGLRRLTSSEQQVMKDSEWRFHLE